ncbi:MAG: hypothetical protein L3K07_02990 [Thermoplasmata archaeon]|nr:hypothetical protein [Thermoplasmata archaeon]
MGDDCEGGEGQRGYGPMVWTAYRAYQQLLAQKIAKRFEESEGPWMDKLAGNLVELVNARWEGGRKGETKEKEILAKIDQLLEE